MPDDTSDERNQLFAEDVKRVIEDNHPQWKRRIIGRSPADGWESAAETLREELELSEEESEDWVEWYLENEAETTPQFLSAEEMEPSQESITLTNSTYGESATFEIDDLQDTSLEINGGFRSDDSLTASVTFRNE